MSTLLDSLLDAARLAECAQADAQMAEFGRGPSGAGYDRAGAYVWPQVPMRAAEAPRRRKYEPRPSRCGSLS